MSTTSKHYDVSNRDEALLAEYVRAFGYQEELLANSIHPLLWVGPLEFDVATAQHSVPANSSDWYDWRPRYMPTEEGALSSLYQELGLNGTGAARFPPLYEALILSYRWAEVDMGAYRLLPNEPGEKLFPLADAMRADKTLFTTLLPNGYVPFGRGPDGNYDPVCFDFRGRQKNGDCRIVRVDHEAILCHSRIQEAEQLAPNFRTLVVDTIRKATGTKAS